MALRVQAGVLTAYFLALLAMPDAASRFWPWPVNAFHGRLYSGAFLRWHSAACSSPAAAAPRDAQAQGLTQLCFGAHWASAACCMSMPAVHRVAWQAPGTWIWMAAFAAFALIGAAMLRGGEPAPARRPRRRRLRRPAQHLQVRGHAARQRAERIPALQAGHHAAVAVVIGHLQQAPGDPL